MGSIMRIVICSMLEPEREVDRIENLDAATAENPGDFSAETGASIGLKSKTSSVVTLQVCNS